MSAAILSYAALGIIIAAAFMPVAAAAPGIKDDHDGECNGPYERLGVRYIPPLRQYDRNGNGVVCVLRGA